ncbi:cytochrome P450 [Bimuria novae-zelandiae CBS 107.79]|uniref:Cytochrome P450 n=1 Tax=Bimuria novae-zelandiae CBS 107.79 TaxID=1447943 RepID=A0A6A5VIF6_9PLEO|nr:cytochrome P450 [Bimuria novae-zelandiae CBS 107.79]
MAMIKVLVTLGVPLLSAVAYVLCIGYRRRSKIYQLRRQGVAMPAGWSWWFGHLRVLDQKLQRLPSDANVYMAMEDMVKDHSDTEVFLMDYWPVFQPVLMISGPDLAIQASIKHDLPKPRDQQDSFRPIIGGPSLITMNEQQWKRWRSLFNPGFSASHMLELVPTIVDSVQVFREQLRGHVDKDVFKLDDMTTRLTMDIITKTTLDTDLHNQHSEHEVSRALNTILKWHSFWDPRILLNPLRPVVQWYYGCILEQFISRELQERFKEMKLEKTASNRDQPKRAKSVVALALEQYIKENQKGDLENLDDLQLDDAFAQVAANQIRLFIFAGNDTTATGIVYTYHMLALHPDALAKLRAELDSVFGNDSDVADQLRERPALINECRYTHAVIKETLRLYPPASSLREGIPGVSLVDRKGTVIPTEGLNATIMHRFIHVNPRIWPRPLEFIPERWLVGPEHELYVSTTSGAYRPFEHGPRNCIGQTLVLNELRIALAMTAQIFHITPAYEEWDTIKAADESSYSKIARKMGLKKDEPKPARGERAYQTSRSGAHPAEGYPCRVTLV